MPVLKFKDGNEWKVANKNVAYEISDIPAPTQEELTFSKFLENDWGIKNWFLNKYQDKIQTQHIRVINGGFSNFPLSIIPFKINMTPPFDNNRTDIWL